MDRQRPTIIFALYIGICIYVVFFRIFGLEGEAAEDVIYINWLNMVRAGLLGLEFYTPETKSWRQVGEGGGYELREDGLILSKLYLKFYFNWMSHMSLIIVFFQYLYIILTRVCRKTALQMMI